MKGAEPPAPSDSEVGRQAVAELLGRVLAAYWLANRRLASQSLIRPAPVEPPLTALATEAYDGR